GGRKIGEDLDAVGVEQRSRVIALESDRGARFGSGQGRFDDCADSPVIEVVEFDVATVVGRAPARIVRGPCQGPDRVLRSDIAGNRAGDAVAVLVGEVAGQFVVDTLDAEEAGD